MNKNTEQLVKLNSKELGLDIPNMESGNLENRINNVKPFTVWKHFKGGFSTIITIAKHSETGEQLVVYRCSGNTANSNHKDGIYARPLEMFLSEVDKEKYPDCPQKYRFEFCGLHRDYGSVSILRSNND